MPSHSKRAHSGETVREEAVNVLLGELLRARGIPARAERRSDGDAPAPSAAATATRPTSASSCPPAS